MEKPLPYTTQPSLFAVIRETPELLSGSGLQTHGILTRSQSQSSPETSNKIDSRPISNLGLKNPSQNLLPDLKSTQEYKSPEQ